ncbi:polysaccharide biosynthesis protein [Jutongia sp.]
MATTMAHRLLKGTLLLTITGFITRILGFFYRIYLADLLGAHYLGIYQLIFPVYAICFTIYGAGIQTALSQVIASRKNDRENPYGGLRLFVIGTVIAMALAILLQLLLWTNAEWVAIHFVMEASLTPYLKIMTVFFPFCCLSACINGYYYGIQDAKIPAMTQVVEQIFRIIFVFGISYLLIPGASPQENCRIAVWGLAVGEISSCFYNVYKLACHLRSQRRNTRRTVYRENAKQRSRRDKVSTGKYQFMKSVDRGGVYSLLWLASTLTVTRLFITLLNSIETVLLPAMLRKYGCSGEEALSIYGVLTGMTFSFLLFPSTITNSLAVLLVPSIAEADAAGDIRMIRKSIILSIRYCLLLGILCTGFFMVFGMELGRVIFHNEMAGEFLVTLSWLCPFLYLATALTSIINGMKKTHISFLITAVSLGVKIVFLMLAVPRYGMRLYLIGLLVSQLLQVILELIYLCPYFRTEGANTDKEERFEPVRQILLPSLLILPCTIAAKSSYQWSGNCFGNVSIVCLLIAGIIFCAVYAAGLFLTGSLTLTLLPGKASVKAPPRR